MKRSPTDIPRASKEQVLSAAKLGENEIRFIVSNYYDAQEMRKRSDMQLRHLGDKCDPDGLLHFWADRQSDLEADILKMLGKYAESRPAGRWMLAQYGVGPVTAAGILAHVDITKAPTAGHIWRFAGLDSSCEWYGTEKAAKIVREFLGAKKKPDVDDVMAIAAMTKRRAYTLVKIAMSDRDGNPQPLTTKSLSAALAKRPYNAQLKQICWHLGECFKRTSHSTQSFYGRIYREHKAVVVARNERGEYAERAKVFFTKSADIRKTLEEGKLPAGNLDSQATRYAAKIFLSHVHAVMYWDRFGQAPPKPFAIEILGHADEIKIPGTDLFPGFEVAYYGRGKERRRA